MSCHQLRDTHSEWSGTDAALLLVFVFLFSTPVMAHAFIMPLFRLLLGAEMEPVEPSEVRSSD